MRDRLDSFTDDLKERWLVVEHRRRDVVEDDPATPLTRHPLDALNRHLLFRRVRDEPTP